jgi:hypothetical protein
MGRIFEKRKHKIFARNAKLSKLFTRIGKEISMAVKAGGPNPEANHRLKVAIQNAKGMNMPKDNIDRAIKKAAGGGEEDYHEMTTRGTPPAAWPSSWRPPPTTPPARWQCAQLLQQVRKRLGTMGSFARVRAQGGIRGGGGR